MSIRVLNIMMMVLVAGWMGIHPATSFAYTNIAVSNNWFGVKGGTTSSVNYRVTNGVLRVTFTGLPNATIRLTATNTTAGYPPVGFYRTAGLTNIMLTMTRSANETKPGRLELVNEDQTRYWYRYFYPQGGVTTTVAYALDDPPFDEAGSNGWAVQMMQDVDPVPFTNWPAVWPQDLGYISEVAVSAFKKDYNTHWLEVRSLVFESDVALDGITQVMGRLYNRFGVRTEEELSEAQKKEDTDQDGMPDYEVILADYQPGYYESNLFEIVSLKVEPDKTRVSWKALRSNNYVVARAPGLDLSTNFTSSGTTNFITKTGVFGWDDLDLSGGMQYFYRVNRE
jgi:hypothetical protein